MEGIKIPKRICITLNTFNNLSLTIQPLKNDQPTGFQMENHRDIIDKTPEDNQNEDIEIEEEIKEEIFYQDNSVDWFNLKDHQNRCFRDFDDSAIQSQLIKQKASSPMDRVLKKIIATGKHIFDIKILLKEIYAEDGSMRARKRYQSFIHVLEGLGLIQTMLHRGYNVKKWYGLRFRRNVRLNEKSKLGFIANYILNFCCEWKYVRQSFTLKELEIQLVKKLTLESQIYSDVAKVVKTFKDGRLAETEKQGLYSTSNFFAYSGIWKKGKKKHYEFTKSFLQIPSSLMQFDWIIQ